MHPEQIGSTPHLRDRLRLDYIFWGTPEPHYSASVLPFLRALADSVAR